MRSYRAGKWCLGVMFFLFIAASCPAYGVEIREVKNVLNSSFNGVVGVVMEDHLEDVISEAEKINAELIVIDMDTPGGLVSSMRAITQKILDSPVPVVVWVSPAGARAASAGAFILEAAHVAAMSPGTNVGAAHPVTAGGEDVPEEMNRKITNDLAAQIRALAEERGRDPSSCEKMVTESASYTAREALQEGVIDVVASDLPTLLEAIDGRLVKLPGSTVKLDLKDYRVHRYEMSPRLKALHFISRPDVAYLLLLVGLYAIIFEVMSPGGFVLGTSGLVLVLLGSLGLRMLPLNWAGIVLLVVGIAVMILDLAVGGIGILSLFGAAALIVGGLVIYRAPGGELLNMSYSFLVGAVVAITVFFLVAAWAVWRSLSKKAVSGSEGLIGLEGVALTDLAPSGTVKCHGEIWEAKSLNGDKIESNTPIRVIRSEGLVLYVEPIIGKKEDDGNDG
ncbi:MAG: hypothetical protein PWR00_419 [Thermovirga sp.]|nr:hypothetical protein [Thermovirga sp.]